MSAHSKGPWRVYPPGTSVPHYDVCDRIVADEPTGRSSSDGPSDADARLIAAAPELLEALEKIAFVLPCEVNRQKAAGSHDCDCLACDLVGDARIAISKARGEGEP